MPGVNVPAIKVDTVGYPLAWPKTAILNFKPSKPALCNLAGKRIYEFPPEKIRAMGLDDASKDEVWQLEFGEFKTPGRYQIVNGKHKSHPFVVGGQVYAGALKAAQKMFYYQRCRTNLTEPHTRWDKSDDTSGYPRLGACHDHAGTGWDSGFYPKKTKRLKMAKGWHDAGNPDMYIPSTGPTVQTLLRAYEAQPGRFGDDNGIPESGNKIPDLLDECLWGLDWMLSMQEADGSFRMRDAIMTLGTVMPGDMSNDKTERWISGVGTASTAKACAALAQASRIYGPFMRGKAGEFGVASRKAWAFLQKHSGRILVDGKGSGQPLWDDATEYSELPARLAAAAEIWVSFRDKTALDFLNMHWDGKEAQMMDPGAWSNISRFAAMRLAEDPSTPDRLRISSRERILKAADAFKGIIEKDGYRYATLPKDYFWGSTSNNLEKAELLLVAARLDPVGHAWAKQAAREQWHHLMGRNPNGFSMVSRVGKGPEKIFHLEWGKKKVPPPGYLIDGPNHHSGPFLSPDAPAKALLWDNPKPLKRSGTPAHALWHNEQSDLWDGGFVDEGKWDTGWWIVLEPDIYYNGNLVRVAAEMQD